MSEQESARVPFPGVVQLGGKRVKMVVLKAEGARIEVLLEATGTPEDLRCAFPMDEGRIEVMLSVRQSREIRGRTQALCRVDAVFSPDGRRPIEAFVKERLAQPVLSPMNFMYDERGVFFWFEAGSLERAKSGVRTRTKSTRVMSRSVLKEEIPPVDVVIEPIEPVIEAVLEQDLGKEKRYELRVRTARVVDAQAGRSVIMAALSEVSANGVRMETDIAPPVGETLVFDIKLPVGRLELGVRAYGEVVWTSSEDGTVTFGVSLTRIADGASGRHWRRFVEEAAERGEFVPAARRGTPLTV